MAFLTDYHVHTEISRDSAAPYYDMVMAEYNAGVRYLCVTDHCDTLDWRTMEFWEPCRDVARREREMYEKYIRRLPEDLQLRMGMELAEVRLAAGVRRGADASKARRPRGKAFENADP